MKKTILSVLLLLSLFLSSGKPDWIVSACGMPYDSRLPGMIVRDSMWYAATDYGVFYSVFENSHWMNAMPNSNYGAFNCVSFYKNFVVAGAETGSVFISPIADPPRFINTSNNMPATYSVNSITVSGNNIFIGRTNREVWVSQDTGKTWVNRTSNIPVIQNGKVYLFTNGSTVYAATNGSGIYKTTNNGVNWTPVNTGLTNLNVRSICFHNSKIFAGTAGGGMFILSDNGQYWTQKNAGLGNLYVNALISAGGRLIAGTDDGVYASANNSDTWYARNSGLPSNRKVLCFTLSSQLHLGLEYNLGWSIEIDEIVTVKQISSTIPDKFSISQNYPNPFNPATKIKINVKENSFVTFKVYDLLGKEVSTLINENLKAGVYEVPFNAGKLSSGIYIYKADIKSGKENFSDSKKMLLVK